MLVIVNASLVLYVATAIHGLDPYAHDDVVAIKITSSLRVLFLLETKLRVLELEKSYVFHYKGSPTTYFLQSYVED